MFTEENLTSPPNRDVLLETARTRNSVPLPLPKPTCGLRLPPERFCLTAANYKLAQSSKKKMTVNRSTVSSFSNQVREWNKVTFLDTSSMLLRLYVTVDHFGKSIRCRNKSGCCVMLKLSLPRPEIHSYNPKYLVMVLDTLIGGLECWKVK